MVVKGVKSQLRLVKIIDSGIPDFPGDTKDSEGQTCCYAYSLLNCYFMADGRILRIGDDEGIQMVTYVDTKQDAEDNFRLMMGKIYKAPAIIGYAGREYGMEEGTKKLARFYEEGE